MSESITINFLQRGLKEARETAKRIAAQVKEASKNLKELAPEARRQFAAKQRELAKERADEIKAMQTKLGLERSAAKIRTRGLGFSAALKGDVDKGKEAFERLRSIGSAAATGNLAAGLGLLGNVPVVGQVAAGVGAIVGIVLPILQRELDARVAAIETRSAVRQQRAFFEADIARRFREDPEFRDRLTRNATRADAARSAALRAGGWRRRGRFMGE